MFIVQYGKLTNYSMDADIEFCDELCRLLRTSINCYHYNHDFIQILEINVH